MRLKEKEKRVLQKFIVMLQKSKQTNYILYILYTNSKFSIHLPCNSTDLLPATKIIRYYNLKQQP